MGSSGGIGGKTLVYFKGCPRPLGCTVLLKGAGVQQLRPLKRVMQVGLRLSRGVLPASAQVACAQVARAFFHVIAFSKEGSGLPRYLSPHAEATFNAVQVLCDVRALSQVGSPVQCWPALLVGSKHYVSRQSLGFQTLSAADFKVLCRDMSDLAARHGLNAQPFLLYIVVYPAGLSCNQ